MHRALRRTHERVASRKRRELTLRVKAGATERETQRGALWCFVLWSCSNNRNSRAPHSLSLSLSIYLSIFLVLTGRRHACVQRRERVTLAGRRRVCAARQEPTVTRCVSSLFVVRFLHQRPIVIFECVSWLLSAQPSRAAARRRRLCRAIVVVDNCLLAISARSGERELEIIRKKKTTHNKHNTQKHTNSHHI